MTTQAALQAEASKVQERKNWKKLRTEFPWVWAIVSKWESTRPLIAMTIATEVGACPLAMPWHTQQVDNVWIKADKIGGGEEVRQAKWRSGITIAEAALETFDEWHTVQHIAFVSKKDADGRLVIWRAPKSHSMHELCLTEFFLQRQAAR